MDSKQLDEKIKYIDNYFNNLPNIKLDIQLKDCGLINDFSKNGLLKILKEYSLFIEKICDIVDKEKLDELYKEVKSELNFRFNDDDYTRESKKITCETPCEHSSMNENTQIGEIIYCNKYLYGEENKCLKRSFLS